MAKTSGSLRAKSGGVSKKDKSIIENYKTSYFGDIYTYKLEKNEYGVLSAVRYVNGKKTNYSADIKSTAKNLRKYS